MAIGSGSLIEVQIGGHMYGNVWMNSWTFEVAGELGDPSPAEWGAAIWNAVKSTYRPLVLTYHGSAFEFVRVREMDDALGEFGEFAVPTAETAGTRSVSTNGPIPSYVSAAVRLTVGTRVTRPGQKRFTGFGEADLDGYNLQPGYLTALNAHMVAMQALPTLGAPALGSEINTVVVSRAPITGLPAAWQPVTGFVINPYATTQNSRKLNHGI